MKTTEAETKSSTGQGTRTKPKGVNFRIIAILVAVAIFVIVGCGVGAKVLTTKQDNVEISSTSVLENIVQIEELSTFTTTYRGIAEVMNEKNAEKVDYYVAYEAKVKAGLDFDKIVVSTDEDTKTITVTLPEVYITDTDVDIASLDYIFVNKKANTSGVSEAAYKACEADVAAESETQETLIDLATENAQNTVRAMIQPLLNQLDETYTLVIE